jgi:hypothetical protein
MSIFAPARTAPVLLALLVCGTFSGCRRTEAEYQRLVAENAQLRSEIERLTRKGIEQKAEEKGGASVGEPDLAATIVDLWGQRFDDINEFRARSRLSGKTIRVTGAAEVQSADSIALTGESKRFGVVRMTVNLSPGYATRIDKGLAALERGTLVTVQGKFSYERNILTEATFVEPAGGRILYTDDLLALSAGVPIIRATRGAPATPAPKSTPAPGAPVSPPAGPAGSTGTAATPTPKATPPPKPASGAPAGR